MGVIKNVVADSNGAKRGLSGILSTLGLLTAAIPSLSVITTVLAYVGGLFGIAGLAHAGKESTVTDHKMSTIAAVFSVILTVCHAVPSLNQYIPLVQEIAGFLGIGVATMSVAKSSS